MLLFELIDWLEKKPLDMVIYHGFGEPHTDRGDYHDLAFDPVEETTIGVMLRYAKSAIGESFYGWKGGEYQMDRYSDVYIGEFGECGEPITKYNILYWEAVQKTEGE